MTDDKKHDDKDRKKLSDEEMEDVAGGDVGGHLLIESSGIRKDKRSKMRKNDTSVAGDQ
jgi:hypothetical protein